MSFDTGQVAGLYGQPVVLRRMSGVHVRDVPMQVLLTRDEAPFKGAQGEPQRSASPDRLTIS